MPFMQASILQIGKPDGASTLAAAAKAVGLQLIAVENISKAIESLSTNHIKMVFIAPDLSLSDLFTHMNGAKINTPVVACGEAQPVKNAVQAIRLGAIEYLSTPFEKALVTALLEKIKPVADENTPIAHDPKTKDMLKQAQQFAQSDASILLRGESGTGKEVYSKYIHAQSPRKNKDFIAVNCAAIPENLLESELFGHEKGAFSGAVSKRIGKFQQADKGTLLLDEISEMDLSLQAKLLRAIQERVIDPVGSSKPVPIDIRLIATTNRKLEDYVAEGKFREDLYFRLNVVMLEIPPLRDRPEDIMPLASYFAHMYGAQNGKSNITFSKEASKKLTDCYWKGNVRELENTLHRAVLMLGDTTKIQPNHIIISPMSLQMMAVEPTNQQAAQAGATGPLPTNAAAAQRYAAASSNFSSGTGAHQKFVGKSLQDVEKELIISTMRYCEGNKEHAANILGITLKILREKLQHYQAA